MPSHTPTSGPAEGPPGRVLLALLAALAACAPRGDYVRPEVPLPAGWNTALEDAVAEVDLEWWRRFADPVLDELIESALVENKDLRAAAAAIDEYAGRLGVSRSAFYPAVDLAVDVGRTRRSEEDARPLGRNEDRENSRYLATLNVAWEADLWGRLRSANEAGAAELLAREEARRALALSLISAVAQSYVELLTLERQLEITHETVAYRAEWLETFDRKGEGGQVSGLEVAQVRHAHQEALGLIPEIELEIALAENQLALLVGRNPGPIPRGKTLEALGQLAVPRGLPADLLARRPDVREREQLLIAAHARVDEVRARYYPDIALTGALGFSSKELSTWLNGSAGLWDVGARAVQPLFDWGRIEGEEQAALARREQLLAGYLKAVQTALGEVENALIAIEKRRELLAVQREHLGTLEEYAALARERYEASLTGASYLEVLDAERNLYKARVAEAGTQRDLAAALIASYKALGGGWDAAVAYPPREGGAGAEGARAPDEGEESARGPHAPVEGREGEIDE
jgi:multidrug efflux system outer membrane protein